MVHGSLLTCVFGEIVINVVPYDEFLKKLRCYNQDSKCSFLEIRRLIVFVSIDLYLLQLADTTSPHGRIAIHSR